MQYWKPGAIYEVECPSCGKVVEFFKDDTARKCGGCGHRFVNPKMDFGCAAYCPYAEQCLGTLPEGAAAQRENLLKDRVAVEMKRYFKTDFKRIGHAGRVARHAEAIGKAAQGNLAVILTAAYLHDIGWVEAERKHGESAEVHHAAEGPAVAREILERLGAQPDLIEEVCGIIAHHHDPQAEDSLNFRVVCDADLLENLDEKQKINPVAAEKLAERIRRSFLTEAGREAAMATLTETR
jgi:DNA-directed RNA polymerase subunit RPC12/RpoP/predicted HD phosphohydrolase